MRRYFFINRPTHTDSGARRDARLRRGEISMHAYGENIALEAFIGLQIPFRRPGAIEGKPPIYRRGVCWSVTKARAAFAR